MRDVNLGMGYSLTVGCLWRNACMLLLLTLRCWRRFRAGGAKAVGLMTRETGLVERLASIENGIGVLGLGCLEGALGRFHQGADVLSPLGALHRH